MYPEYSDPDVPIIFLYPISRYIQGLIPEKNPPYPTNVGYNKSPWYPQVSHSSIPQLRLQLASETPSSHSAHSCHGPAEEELAVSRCWNLAPWMGSPGSPGSLVWRVVIRDGEWVPSITMNGYNMILNRQLLELTGMATLLQFNNYSSMILCQKLGSKSVVSLFWTDQKWRCVQKFCIESSSMQLRIYGSSCWYYP